jgi:hypothetical protein
MVYPHDIQKTFREPNTRALADVVSASTSSCVVVCGGAGIDLQER